MCFSPSASFIAWGASIASAWYLYHRNKSYDRWNAGFIMTFSSIQLFEGGIWLSDPAKKNKFNEILTQLILLGLTAQPLMQTFQGYKYTSQAILWFLSWFYLGFFLFSLWRVLRSKPGSFQTTVGQKGHLVWHDRQSKNFLGPTVLGVMYMIGLFLPLLFMKSHKGWPLILTGVLTALYSLYIAGPGEFGSYWCYTAVIYSFISIVMV
jgi:hypothetical protein